MPEDNQEMKETSFGDLRRQLEPIRKRAKALTVDAGLSPGTKEYRRTVRNMGREVFLEQQRGTKDPVTGLFNRRFIETQLDMRIADASRKQESFRILILDLDHFKWVNDGWGHPVGDDVLRCSGALQTRRAEPIGRWGGEEFLQILSFNSDDKGLSTLVSRHMDSIEKASAAILSAHPYNEKADPEHKLNKVTISMGIVDFVPGMNKEELLARVGKALYKAKETRNKAVYAKAVGTDDYVLVDIPRVPVAELQPTVT